MARHVIGNGRDVGEINTDNDDSIAKPRRRIRPPEVKIFLGSLAAAFPLGTGWQS